MADGIADDSPTPALALWYEEGQPDWIPPLPRVPPAPDGEMCRHCLSSHPVFRQAAGQVVGLWEFLGADPAWKPPTTPRPSPPVADVLPCLDCPDRPTETRTRTKCPYTFVDLRTKIRAYVEFPSWWDKEAKDWQFKSGSLAHRLPHECKRLCRVIGYPEGDSNARELAALDQKAAKREARADRAIRRGREPGKVGRPTTAELTAVEREIAESVESMIAHGLSRAAAVKSVARIRKCSAATVRKVLLRVARKHARQKPVT